MLAPFARRPLTQSPRYVRSLAALPRVPSSRFATPRFSSTTESDSSSTSESDLLKSAETALSDAAELYDQHDVLSKRFEEIVKVVDEVKSLSKEAQPSSHTRSKPVFSKGSDVAKLSAEYKLLNTENAWKLTAAGTGLYKTFFFKTYARCLVSFLPLSLLLRCMLNCQDFIQIIGINSKARSHHPHMSFVGHPIYIYIFLA
jgi:pterin-4a-carbinolamine dehydratase